MILIRSTALGQIKEMERNNKIKINKCVLSLPGSGPSSLSDTPPLSGPSHCGSGHRRRRVRDRRQLGGHQDDVTTGRRGGAHGGGDALRGRGPEEEDGGGVIWQEGQILLPRMPFSSLSVLYFFFSGGFSPCCQTHFHPPAFVFSHILFCAEEKLTRNISQRFGGKNLKPQIIFLPLWFLHICFVCTFSSPASFPHVFVPPPEAARSRAGKTCRV